MNMARDYRANVELRLLGWRVIRVWECDVKSKENGIRLLDRLYRQITNVSYREYGIQDNVVDIAAEDTATYGTPDTI